MVKCKEQDTILDLSKTSKIKAEPVREETPPAYPPHITDILAANPFWRVPPFQEQFVLDLSYAAKTELNDTNCDSSSYCSSNNSTEFSDNTRQRHSKTFVKDESYFERRRKNNLAAKKSRDAKRRRETEIKARVIILEEENKRLKQQLATCCCGSVRKSLYENLLFVWLPLFSSSLCKYFATSSSKSRTRITWFFTSWFRRFLRSNRRCVFKNAKNHRSHFYVPYFFSEHDLFYNGIYYAY